MASSYCSELTEIELHFRSLSESDFYVVTYLHLAVHLKGSKLLGLCVLTPQEERLQNVPAWACQMPANQWLGRRWR